MSSVSPVKRKLRNPSLTSLKIGHYWTELKTKIEFMSLSTLSYLTAPILIVGVFRNQIGSATHAKTCCALLVKRLIPMLKRDRHPIKSLRS